MTLKNFFFLYKSSPHSFGTGKFPLAWHIEKILIISIHTCWFSVFIEKAEMSKSVLSNNPNEIRIHIICKSEQNEKSFWWSSYKWKWNYFSYAKEREGKKLFKNLLSRFLRLANIPRNSDGIFYIQSGNWIKSKRERRSLYFSGKIFIFPFMYREIPQIPSFHKWFCSSNLANGGRKSF